MPSLRTFFNFLISAQTAFGISSPIWRLAPRGSSATCPDPQLSCHNTSAVDNLCCFNSPGGSLLQTQFWDTDPVSGPEDSWTIHGLWPDNCDGTYDANCDDARAYTNITDILKAAGENDLLDYMEKFWVSTTGTAESFWEHEWGKHGTCISTLEPDCYTDYKNTEEVPDFFTRTVSLFKSLPSYEWLSAAGITPSDSKTYSASDIQAALSKNHGGKEVYLGCSGDELDEIWYFFNVKGSIQTGDFVPSDLVGGESSCPSTGIKYLPKGSSGGGSNTTTTSSSSAPSSTPTGPAFSGKGYLNTITSGSKKGCIISAGTWYTTGTCATFTATSSSGSNSTGSFTLKSSKGNCAVDSQSKLVCGSDVGKATTFSAQGTSLSYDGSTAFSADTVPSGSTQETVYVGGGHDTSLSLEWQSV